MEDRDQTIQYLTRKKKELTEKREKLLRPVQDVEKQLAAVSETLSIVLRDESATVETGFPIRKLKNLTQTQALAVIADYNGGEIKSLEVKAIMIDAKLMKNTKNAAHMVNGVIARSGLFERVKRGHYRLKEASQLKGDGVSGIMHLQQPVQ